MKLLKISAGVVLVACLVTTLLAIWLHSDEWLNTARLAWVTWIFPVLGGIGLEAHRFMEVTREKERNQVKPSETYPMLGSSSPRRWS